MTGNGHGELGALIASRAVFPVFQPIVDLASGSVIGYEALARGPAEGDLRAPDRLFAAAREADLLPELDALCRSRALEVARASGLAGPLGLFLNVEPDALGTGLPAELLGASPIPMTVEFTERSLLADPARLLALAERLRALGIGIALDDVGADPASVALMPFLRPDVVKLDMRLVQQHPDAGIAQVMTAVTAYAEQSGAWVLAEGIETEAHEFAALSLGAQLGQGWRYGRPGALPPDPSGAGAPGLPLVRVAAPAPAPAEATPYRAVAGRLAPRRGSKPLLAAVSRLLETQAGELRGHSVVLATFEDGAHFTAGPARSYAALATRSALVVAFGTGLPEEPARGVRGVDLAPADPLVDEWDVVVVGPHFAAALLARERHDTADSSFDYVLTYDRGLVLEVARLLMARALPVAVDATARTLSPTPSR